MMNESIKEIKSKFDNCNEGELSAFIATYQGDERAGVQTLVKRAEKQVEKLAAERERLYEMQTFERKYRADYPMICGIDEAGRGPLAGPVVAGAVILPENADILYINDSKKLSAKKREELYGEITERAVAWSVGQASPEEIDEINILQATYLAMRRAIAALSVQPDILLNDAVVIPDVATKQVGIVKGDAKSASIAAASILAKVTRDRMMAEYDAEYPAYGFAAHKGYGTAEHYAAIRKNGMSPIHRRSFLKELH